MAPRDLVSVGVITGAHGIRGEVKLRSFTADPAAIAGYSPLETAAGGKIEITNYELVDDSPERCRFIRHETILADAGSSGSLIPPHEYHTIHNPNPKQAAISLHIYQGTMGDCSIYEPEADGWYAKGRKMLCLDPVDCK